MVFKGWVQDKIDGIEYCRSIIGSINKIKGIIFPACIQIPAHMRIDYYLSPKILCQISSTLFCKRLNFFWGTLADFS
jgi:hypothetical protein